MPSAQGGSLLLPVHLMSVQGPHRHCRTLRGSISWGHQNAERCHFLMEQCQLGAHDRICTTPYLISPGNTQATFGKPESAGSRGISGCRCQCQEDCGPGGGKVLPGWRARPPPRTHAGQTRPRPMLEGEGVVRPQLERLLVEGRASVSGAEAPGGT